MPNTRDLDHLELVEWNEPLPRRKHGHGRPPKIEDKIALGKRLLDDLDIVTDSFQERRRAAPAGINPQYVFKLKLHPDGDLQDEQLEQMGLRFLGRGSKQAIVVFPDDDTLSTMRRQLREFAELEPAPHKYDHLAAIIEITELEPSDRVGFRLSTNPLSQDEIAALDIELWHLGDRARCKQKIDELRGFLERRQLTMTDWWIGDSICLARARVNADILAQLLATDYVKEIDRRPKPTFEMLDIVNLRLGDIHVEGDLPNDLTGILVIDSGVTGGHPLIAPVLGDAQVFPDGMRQRITGGPEDGDEVYGGHGTSVAGIAAYSDIGECLETRTFEGSARIFSARVLDDNNSYDEDELLEHQLADAVEYFVTKYPIINVINISLGSDDRCIHDGASQFRFAAAIDELAYQYRDRNILFVVSAGNLTSCELDAEFVRSQYPGYLVEYPKARLIDPATSALAVTVGGIAYGVGRDLDSPRANDVDVPIAGNKGFPSPFTRIGWSVDGAIKPEFVDFAGDWLFEHGGRISSVPGNVGVPALSKRFAPPEGRLFRTVAGTSFAAPRVSNIAARLFREFPGASPNLIRALLADSARIPMDRPGLFANMEEEDEKVLQVYGYGQPDFERARWSAQNEVLLVAEGRIEVGRFIIYTVPPLPEEFLPTLGEKRLSVTLAFDPPTRHTRWNSYLGVTMDFYLFRNVDPGVVKAAFEVLTDEQKRQPKDLQPKLGNLEKNHIQLTPGINIRKKGTLQHAWIRIAGPGWKYDGNPLVLVVSSQRKWAREEIMDQRYAVIVSVAHPESSVNLYATISQQARVWQRARIRV